MQTLAQQPKPTAQQPAAQQPKPTAQQPAPPAQQKTAQAEYLDHLNQTYTSQIPNFRKLIDEVKGLDHTSFPVCDVRYDDKKYNVKVSSDDDLTNILLNYSYLIDNTYRFMFEEGDHLTVPKSGKNFIDDILTIYLLQTKQPTRDPSKQTKGDDNIIDHFGAESKTHYNDNYLACLRIIHDAWAIAYLARKHCDNLNLGETFTFTGSSIDSSFVKFDVLPKEEQYKDVHHMVAYFTLTDSQLNVVTNIVNVQSGGGRKNSKKATSKKAGKSSKKSGKAH